MGVDMEAGEEHQVIVVVPPPLHEMSSDDDDNDKDDVERPSRLHLSPRPHSSPQLWPQSYRQSTDAYSLGASPKAAFLSPSSWGEKSALSKRRRKRCASLESLSDHFENQLPYKETTSVDTGLTTPLLVSSPYQPCITDVGSQNQQNIPKCKTVEILPSFSFLPSIKEEDLQVNEGSTGKSSYLQATFNGVNVMAGVGLLSCPFALKEGGWLGLVALVCFGVICCYTGHLLRKCMDSQPQGILTSYPDIGQLAFGKIGRTFISIVLYAELYSYCVEYLVLEGDNLSKLFPNFKLRGAGINMGSHATFAVLATLVILPTVWLENLRCLSYLSFMGVVTTCAVLGLVIWVGVADGVGFTHTSPMVKLQDLPLAVGVYAFCYSGHAVFPNIYYSMEKKSKYTAVLVISFILCFIVYAIMAVVGFCMFGDQTLSQITLNLPQGYKASYVALYLTILSPFTKFALVVSPIANGLQELVPTRNLGACQRRALSMTIRTLLTISTLCVATLVPFFGYMMSFIGSVLSMLVNVILPCACFLKIYKDKAMRWEVILCSIIISVGMITGIGGTYSSVLKISSHL